MKGLSFKGKMIRVLIAVIIGTISLLPPIMSLINSRERAVTIFLDILLLIGELFLRWFFLFIFIFVLHAISNGLFMTFFHGIGMTESAGWVDVDTIAGSALVASFIIVIVLQFCASWGLGKPLLSNLATLYFPHYNM